MCLVTQSCPTLCNPMDHRPPGSSVHRILQARVLERVTIPFSRVSSLPIIVKILLFHKILFLFNTKEGFCFCFCFNSSASSWPAESVPPSSSEFSQHKHLLKCAHFPVLAEVGLPWRSVMWSDQKFLWVFSLTADLSTTLFSWWSAHKSRDSATFLISHSLVTRSGCYFPSFPCGLTNRWRISFSFCWMHHVGSLTLSLWTTEWQPMPS